MKPHEDDNDNGNDNDNDNEHQRVPTLTLRDAESEIGTDTDADTDADGWPESVSESEGTKTEWRQKRRLDAYVYDNGEDEHDEYEEDESDAIEAEQLQKIDAEASAAAHGESLPPTPLVSPSTSLSSLIHAAPSHRAPSLPLTSVVPSHLPHHSILRRLAARALQADVACSDAFHRVSLFPFDLFLVPFGLVCGSYGMPIVIPLLAWMESLRLAAILTTCTVLTVCLTERGKRWFARLRPHPSLVARKFIDLRRLERNFSFPSGDSAQGAVLAYNMYRYIHARQSSIALNAAAASASTTSLTSSVSVASLLSPSPCLLILPFVMLARVYFGCHWWSDTFGGAAIGLTMSHAVWTVSQLTLGWPVEV